MLMFIILILKLQYFITFTKYFIVHSWFAHTLLCAILVLPSKKPLILALWASSFNLFNFCFFICKIPGGFRKDETVALSAFPKTKLRRASCIFCRVRSRFLQVHSLVGFICSICCTFFCPGIVKYR